VSVTVAQFSLQLSSTHADSETLGSTDILVVIFQIAENPKRILFIFLIFEKKFFFYPIFVPKVFLRVPKEFTFMSPILNSYGYKRNSSQIAQRSQKELFLSHFCFKNPFLKIPKCAISNSTYKF